MTPDDTHSPANMIRKFNEKQIEKRAPSSVFSLAALSYFVILMLALVAYLVYRTL
jgi:hypothetical protein